MIEKSYETILRRKQVEARTGLSRSTIYARMAAGTFPCQIDLGGGKSVGWLESEIDSWIASRIKNRATKVTIEN